MIVNQTAALDAAVLGMSAAVRRGPHLFVIAFVIAIVMVIATVTTIAFMAPNHRVGGEKP